MTPALANNRYLQEDTFDAAMLRVDEGRYLREIVPDVPVLTESGTENLSAIMASQPTILALTYYSCGHACPVTMQNLSRVLPAVDIADFRVVVLSFDSNDNLHTLRHARSGLGQVPDNWTFGLLSDEDSATLTASIGFNFFFSERDQIFVHPAVLVFLSPRGEVMRYLYGTDLRAQDIELALVESRNRAPRLNELVDMVKLACFQFDASRSRYALHPAVVFGGLGFGILGLTGLAALAYRPPS